MNTENASTSTRLHAMVSRFVEWLRRTPCRWGRHDWLTVTTRGGTLRLLYKRRTCVRCLKREMMASRWVWVDPFVLTHEWEREDLESGRVIDDEYDIFDIRTCSANGEQHGCDVRG